MSDGFRFISSVLSTGSAAHLREVSDDHFVGDEIPVIRYIREHFRLYGSLPLASTVQEETGTSLLPAVESLDYYTKRVEDRYLYNLLRVEFDAMKSSMRAYDMERTRAIVDNMRRCTRHTASDRSLLTSGEAAREVIEGYEAEYLGSSCVGIPSGWATMDLITDGYQPGDLVAYVARPAQGKTYLLLAQALFAWESGRGVVIATMEMPIKQITTRILAISTGINPKYIRRKQLSTMAMRRLREYAEYLATDDRMVMYAGGKRKSPEDLDVLIQEYGPECVYVDGVHMMTPDRDGGYRSSQRNDRVSNIFDQLNSITVERRLPIVITTHLNRNSGAEGKTASLETVAYSDAIGTHSSLVISVSGGEPPYQRSRKVLRFIKGREGEEGEITVNYNFSPIDFSEVRREAGDSSASTEGGNGGDYTNLDWVAS